MAERREKPRDIAASMRPRAPHRAGNGAIAERAPEQDQRARIVAEVTCLAVRAGIAVAPGPKPRADRARSVVAAIEWAFRARTALAGIAGNEHWRDSISRTRPAEIRCGWLHSLGISALGTRHSRALAAGMLLSLAAASRPALGDTLHGQWHVRDRRIPARARAGGAACGTADQVDHYPTVLGDQGVSADVVLPRAVRLGMSPVRRDTPARGRTCQGAVCDLPGQLGGSGHRRSVARAAMQAGTRRPDRCRLGQHLHNPSATRFAGANSLHRCTCCAAISNWTSSGSRSVRSAR